MAVFSPENDEYYVDWSFKAELEGPYTSLILFRPKFLEVSVAHKVSPWCREAINKHKCTDQVYHVVQFFWKHKQRGQHDKEHERRNDEDRLPPHLIGQLWNEQASRSLADEEAHGWKTDFETGDLSQIEGLDPVVQLLGIVFARRQEEVREVGAENSPTEYLQFNNSKSDDLRQAETTLSFHQGSKVLFFICILVKLLMISGRFFLRPVFHLFAILPI